MGQDEDAVIHCKDIMKSIIQKFPEAKPELKNMIGNIDKGEAVVLTNVQDVESRLKLLKIFTHLRLAAVTRGNGMDKSYHITPNSVQLLRRRFAPLLGFTQEELENNDASSSSSDSSSSSSRKKKKKKSKKSKKKKKDKKKKKKKDKKEKKAKRKRSASVSSAEDAKPQGDAPAQVQRDEPAPPAPVPVPDESNERRVKGPAMPPSMPVPDNDDDGDDDFGPAQSYREAVGDEAYYANQGADTIVMPVLKKEEEKRKGRDEWMTMLPESGTGPLGSIAWRHGKARGADGSKAAIERSRNDWTMTPAEKANTANKRVREEDEEEEELLKYQQFLRDQEANARAREQYEKATADRKQSLMEMHQEKMKETEEAPIGRWNRERDFDSAGMIDSKRLTEAVANAGSSLKSKFGHGSRHFLA
eukprot:TRINITY_DN6957_c0_g1_i1.p1 TRINITY_DN6957_c0_g1~~TRINITY_DN6957_c0_g1_i1.p1  ORF type:complete len:417 (+),score=149.15 TRINITY_DN6957_c0_g1_i1:423-1673(+)